MYANSLIYLFMKCVNWERKSSFKQDKVRSVYCDSESDDCFSCMSYILSDVHFWSMYVNLLCVLCVYR